MKTLMINGSPKKNGDTQALLSELRAHLKGEVRELSLWSDIQPCSDCRYCWNKPGCAIQDEMQAVYPFLLECDNVVLASPIWFSALSGPTLNIASRLQTLFAAIYFRNEPVPLKPKNGVLILVGAEIGTEITPTQTALTILKFMNARRSNVDTVYSLDTNNRPAANDQAALERCRAVAEKLNQGRADL